jgi:hypothetical protein
MHISSRQIQSELLSSSAMRLRTLDRPEPCPEKTAQVDSQRIAGLMLRGWQHKQAI